MSEFIFKLPDLGEGTVEAEIVEWYVKPGDTVVENQTVVDVMTDKATVEVPAPVDGTILRISGEPGDMVAVGAELYALETQDGAVARPQISEKASRPDKPPQTADNTSDEIKPVEEKDADNAQEAKPAPPNKPADSTQTPPVDTAPASGSRRRVLTSPAVRKHAAEAGVALADVPGSGPNGRILMQDFTNYIDNLDKNLDTGKATAPKAQSHPAKKSQVSSSDSKVIGVRRLIAQRMAQSMHEIPHFAYVEEVDVTELEALRVHLNNRHQTSLSILPFVAQAVMRSLPEHPQCNAHYLAEEGVLRHFSGVHLGIAAHTPDGLKVPVIHNAHSMDIWSLSQAISQVAELARTGAAKPADLSGSTITVTSLGRMGGVVSTPIINYPEVAIVGVNKMTDKLSLRQGQVTSRMVMNLSSSFDHRFVDGFNAAAFIQDVKQLLEHPATLFIDPP